MATVMLALVLVLIHGPDDQVGLIFSVRGFFENKIFVNLFFD